MKILKWILWPVVQPIIFLAWIERKIKEKIRKRKNGLKLS